MGKQSRKFIDKKSAVKFKLMHRSQYDPLIADENAPKFVLVPVAGDLEKADELVHYEPSAGASEDEVLDAKYKRLAEQAQFGIYYDDDYDYMQHLKEVGAPDAVVLEARPTKGRQHLLHHPHSAPNRFDLPAEVFPSAHENELAPGDIAAMQNMPDGGLTADMLDLDLDVLAQLDDAAEHCDDWAIDDDFVAKAEGAVDYEIASGDEEYALPAGAWRGAGAGADEWETDDDDDGDSDAAHYSSDDDDDVHRGEETRSRFTEYSMTSSIMHRNDKLQLLDEQFERMYADYDSDEVGSAGGSDEEGEGAAARGRDIEEFDAVLDEYLANKPILVYDPEDKPDAGVKATGVVRAVIADAVEEEMTEEEMTAWRLRQEQKDEWIAEQHALQRRTRDDDDEAKWDCETYLSTYSNLYNHPRVIAEPRAPRTQTTAIAEALDADADADGDADGHDDDDGESVCAANKGAARSKGETADERRARKQAVKAERRERRSEKKQTREAFKAEKIRQDKMEASARTQAVRL